MKIKILAIAAIGALTLSSLANAQNTMPKLNLMSGESVLVLDPYTGGYMNVTCDGRRPSPSVSRIEFFSDDNCSTLVAIKSSSESCGKIAGNDRVWSARFAGECINIEDTNLTNACYNLEALGSNSATIIYSDDHCKMVTAVVNRSSQCSSLSGQSGRAWSVKLSGSDACLNIEDTSV